MKIIKKSIFNLLLLLVLISLSACSFKDTPVYQHTESIKNIYVDKDINYIVYFGDTTYNVFQIKDPIIKYLIKNAKNAYYHVNIADNYYVENSADIIQTNFFDIYFDVKTASPNLLRWAKKHNLYKDGNTYSYQTYLKMYRFLSDDDSYKIIQAANETILFHIESLNSQETVHSLLKPANITVRNNNVYYNNKLLKPFLFKKTQYNNTRYKIIYDTNLYTLKKRAK